MIKAVIGCRLPSLNEYIDVCRSNRFQAAKFKRNVEANIGFYLRKLPKFERPVKIHFHWIEQNRRRDYDNIAFAKKFVLDSMVKLGKLKDDNRRHVIGFSDTFEVGDRAKVILYIEEVTNDTKRENS